MAYLGKQPEPTGYRLVSLPMTLGVMWRPDDPGLRTPHPKLPRVRYRRPPQWLPRGHARGKHAASRRAAFIARYGAMALASGEP